MSSQSNFTEQLIALRDHYQAQLAGYELKASQAREQLSHINALLVDQLVTNEDFEEASFSALIPSPDLRAITSAEALVAAPEETALAVQKESTLTEETRITTEEEPPITPKASQAERMSAPAKEKVEAVATSKRLKMFAPYEGMTKIEAVYKLLIDHIATPLTIEEIIRQLYGELDMALLKIERQRMQSTIMRGKGQKLWKRVAGKEARFTPIVVKVTPAISPETPKPLAVEALPESSPKPARAAKAPKQKPTRKTKTSEATIGTAKPAVAPQASESVAEVAPPKTKAKSKGDKPVKTTAPATQPIQPAKAKATGQKGIGLEMASEYEGTSLRESVKKVMQAHRGQVMNSRSVATVLYPKLDEESYRKLKDRLNTIFSKEYLEGSLERVGDERGAYRLK